MSAARARPLPDDHADAVPARRTIQITGHPGPTRRGQLRLVEVERRRPPRRMSERVGPRPDRIALWAFLMGVFMVLVALASSHGA